MTKRRYRAASGSPAGSDLEDRVKAMFGVDDIAVRLDAEPFRTPLQARPGNLQIVEPKNTRGIRNGLQPRRDLMPDRNRSDDPSIRTTDRLRADIDEGRTGDKVGFSDPATAPLGTDDEAAGTPPSKAAIAAARAKKALRPRPCNRRGPTKRPSLGHAAVHRLYRRARSSGGGRSLLASMR